MFDKTIWSAIIIGIVSAVAFEIIKYLYIAMRDKLIEKAMPFSLSGYWYSKLHSQNNAENKLYHGAEICIIKQAGTKIVFDLYQLTSENSYHTYKGFGVIRGNRASMCYAINKKNANQTGTYDLRIGNEHIHSIVLQGVYCEYYSYINQHKTNPVVLLPLPMPKRLGLFFRKQKYILSLLKGILDGEQAD